VTARIVIDIPQRMPTGNVWLKVHYMARAKFKKSLAILVFTVCRPPRQPLTRCRVLIERYSTQKPDKDNLYGGMKPLLDVLQPVSKRHPQGLGFFVDDSEACIDLTVRHVKGTAKRTVVTIDEMEPDSG
jgi:Holliday junction resolvase RusA-like endonuclease